jgi:hypothetical protein
MNRLWFALLFALLPLIAAAAPLELLVIDSEGRKLPARVLLRPVGQDCLMPNDAVELRIFTERWFMCDGNVVIDVPPGTVEVRVERGLEYGRIRQNLEIPPDGLRQTFRLARWVDLRAMGYRSGENHVHIDTLRLGPMLVCEDLDFGSSLTWWRGPDPKRPIPPGSGHIRMLTYAGRSVAASIYDSELEYPWGAAYITGATQPMSIEAVRERPNFDYLRAGVEAGAIVHYQGGYSREVLLDALLGLVHTVNICNNNFGLHNFQPRSRNSNLLKVEGLPEYGDTPEGMMRLNMESYYRLLNCGLKLAAGAGTACDVKRAPVGYNRAYVHAPGEPTIHEFYKAWAAGRNFVTNGPIVFLRSTSGAQPGDEISLRAGGGKVRFSARVLSDCPLTTAELVVNGEVRHAFPIRDRSRMEAEVEVELQRGSWVALRATARDDLLSDSELARYTHLPDSAGLRARPSRLRFAHTSPVYVQVGGRGTAVPAAIEDARRMLDALEQYAARATLDVHRPTMRSALVDARRRLSQLATGER